VQRLHFANDDKHQSIIGGCFTIVTVMLFVLFFNYKATPIFNRSNPKFKFSTKPAKKTGINFNETGDLLMFRITDGIKSSKFDPTKIELVPYLVNLNGKNLYRKRISFKECTDADLNKIIKDDNVRHLFLKNTYCLNSSEIEIKGSLSSFTTFG